MIQALGDRMAAARAALTGHAYQIGEVTALRRLLRLFSYDCVFDVGANVGQYASMLRRDVGFKGWILSFEPHPDVFARLEREARNDPKWVCIQTALTDRDGTLPFNCVAADQFSSLLKPDDTQIKKLVGAGAQSRTIDVAAAKLDSVFAELRQKYAFSTPLLKLDTQGNDIAVVQGARAVAAEFIGIQTELAFRPLYEGATRYDEAIAFFAELGFSPAALFPNNAGHFPRLFEMDCLFVRNDLSD